MIRKPSFFGIFVKSPFKRLERHMLVVYQCAELLPLVYRHCQEENWEHAEETKGQIASLESEADRLKRKIQIKLHSDLFLPVPRSDILALLQVQDNIANQAEDIAGLLVGRRMVFPEELLPHIDSLMMHMLKTCSKASEVTSELKDLLEAGFDGVVVKFLKDTVKDLDLLEAEADIIQAKIRKRIFAVEKDHPPIDVLFWYEFVNRLASLIDWAQRVGSQLLILSSR